MQWSRTHRKDRIQVLLWSRAFAIPGQETRYLGQFWMNTGVHGAESKGEFDVA